MSQYQFRPSVFQKDLVLKLTDTALEVKRPSGIESIPFSSIKKVSLHFNPAYRSRPSSYSCKIDHGSRDLMVSSLNYLGFARFENKENQYKEFIKDFHSKLPSHTLCIHGVSKGLYYSLWFFFILLILFFIAIITTLMLQSKVLISICIFIGALFTLRSFYLYIKMNRPFQYSPNNLPLSYTNKMGN